MIIVPPIISNHLRKLAFLERLYPLPILVCRTIIVLVGGNGCATAVEAPTVAQTPVAIETPTAAETPTVEVDPTLQTETRLVAEFLGMVLFETGRMFNDTEVGGLSAIVYDAETGVYYLLSDDRSERDKARFYTAAIDLADGRLDEGDVVLTVVTTLLDPTGQPFEEGFIDAEGMALGSNGSLYIASEGNPTINPPAFPFVGEFALDGRQLGELTLPEKFVPDAEGTKGVRNNGAFEGLTIQPSGRFLFAATEEALVQDGPAASDQQGSLSRIVQFDMQSGQAVAEYVYLVEQIPGSIIPLGSNNGLSDILALDDEGGFLALERSYAPGVGNTIRLYTLSSDGALDVQQQEALRWSGVGVADKANPPLPKSLLVDFAELGITPDNLEAMTLGPRLADGRQVLIVVSDNNFNPLQTTQFIALALRMD